MQSSVVREAPSEFGDEFEEEAGLLGAGVPGWWVGVCTVYNLINYDYSILIMVIRFSGPEVVIITRF